MNMLTPLSPWEALENTSHMDVYFALDDGRQVFLISGNRTAQNVFLSVEDGHGRKESPTRTTPFCTASCTADRETS